jgi:thioredoxin-dependent peroxiredoxin
MNFKRLPLLLLMLALTFALTACMTAAAAPAVGTTAPDFTLKSQDGNSITLSQFRGKWVVLYFYPRDMTSGCTIEAHNFQRDQDKFQAANAVVLGVSVDDTKSHQQFCTKEGLTFKLLSDSDHKVSEEYGSLTNMGVVKFSKRHTFLIDPQGKVVKEYTDVDSDINQHSEQVLAALSQLQK